METVNIYPWFVFNEAALFRFEIRIISRIVPTDYQNGWESSNRGGSRIFFRRGCPRLLLYFNTNKPHSFFFCRIPAVLENRGSSQGVAHPLHPPPRSAPVQWYYSDESPSFAHTLHLWSTCTYPKWLSDWPARENNGIFYEEIVMYTLVNISHQDVTFFIVLYSQTTFCFPFLS